MLIYLFLRYQNAEVYLTQERKIKIKKPIHLLNSKQALKETTKNHVINQRYAYELNPFALIKIVNALIVIKQGL